MFIANKHSGSVLDNGTAKATTEYLPALPCLDLCAVSIEAISNKEFRASRIVASAEQPVRGSKLLWPSLPAMPSHRDPRNLGQYPKIIKATNQDTEMQERSMHNTAHDMSPNGVEEASPSTVGSLESTIAAIMYLANMIKNMRQEDDTHLGDELGPPITIQAGLH